MSHSITFEFNNGINTFYAGSLVAGNVTFDLYEDVGSVKEVIVQIKGKSKLHWSERRNKHTHHYSNKEKYFETGVILMQNIPNDRLSKGRHTFPFSFLLPGDIPATFHFASIATAHVNYFVKGKIRRPGFHFDIKEQTEIILLANNATSVYPSNAMEPSVARDSKYVCCCCCKHGPITAEIALNKTCYFPGEAMQINLSIENMSNTDLEQTNINLKRIVHLQSTTKGRTFKDSVFTVTYEGCQKRKTATLNKEIQLPPYISPTDLPFCRIIRPHYVIELEGTIDGCHYNLRVPAPIFIASNVVTPIASQPAVAPQPQTLPSAPSDDPPPPFANATAPPPNYSEKQDAPTNNTTTATGGQYYDWNQSAFTYN